MLSLIFQKICGIINLGRKGAPMDAKQKKCIKWLLIGISAAAVLFVCIRFAVPMTRLLATEEGRDRLCRRVESFGLFAPTVFVLLMALQIVIAFIPGGPLELIGGMLFGGWKGVLFTTLGALLGTLLVFGLVRKFGRPLVRMFVSDEKMQRFRFLQNEERLAFWVFILFLIPGIPKDMLTYLIPLTPMKGRQFLLLSVLARFPSLAASVLVGDSLADGRYWLSVLLCAFAAAAVFIGYQMKHYLFKEHGDTK